MDVDWEQIYEEWLLSGRCDLTSFGGRSLDFLRHVQDDLGHVPTAADLREIVELVDLVDGERLERRLEELAEQDWDVEAILAQ